jgi:hypothetical protein
MRKIYMTYVRLTRCRAGWDTLGLVGSTGLVSASSWDAGWAMVVVGGNDLCENGCMLEIGIWGWGALCVCRSADCCVPFLGK